MSNTDADGDLGWATGAFVELRANLDYARDLIHGGQHLERLQVGAFDVADLYRAAWVQAVSALDHWVHRELYARALAFALRVDVPRPAKFLALRIPMRLFEDVHHHSQTLRARFEVYLREQFGYQSFQAPDKIKEALGHVSEVTLWPAVAKRLTDETGQHVTSEQVQITLKEIVGRRNRIAHEADRDPRRLHEKETISAQQASNTVDQVERIANAILRVIGPPAVTTDETEIADPDLDEHAFSENVTIDQPTAAGKSLAAQSPDLAAASVAASAGTTKRDLYRRFWSRLAPVIHQRGWTTSAPPADNWWSLPAGVTGATWMVSFARFGCRSELIFEHPDRATNLARWKILADQREDIIARFGDDLVFDDLPGRKSCRVGTKLIGPTVADQDHWADVLGWMEDTQTRLRSAIAAVGGVPTMHAPTQT